MGRRYLAARQRDNPLMVLEAPLLEVDRGAIIRNRSEGFVLKSNSKLTLIHVIDPDLFLFRGFAVFRNADVRRWRYISQDELLARAVVLNHLQPRLPDGLIIGSMRDAVSSIGELFPLVTLYREQMEPELSHTGKLLRTTRQVTTLLPLSRRLIWRERIRYNLSDITLIEFGGPYETALAQITSNEGLFDKADSSSEREA